MKKENLEIYVCLILALVGVGAYATVGMAEGSASVFLLKQERAMGALDYQTLPKICAIGMIALSLVNISMILFKRKKEEAIVLGEPQADIKPMTNNKKTIFVRTAGSLVLLVLYALLLPYIHFVVLTAVFLFVLFFLYGKTKIAPAAMVAGIGATAFWIVFIKIANLSI